jgi:hypothetical protein
MCLTAHHKKKNLFNNLDVFALNRPPGSFQLTGRFITFEIPVIFYYQQVDLPGLTDLTF